MKETEEIGMGTPALPPGLRRALPWEGLSEHKIELRGIQKQAGGFHSRVSASRWLMSLKEISERQATCSIRHTIENRAVGGKRKPENTKGRLRKETRRMMPNARDIHSTDLKGKNEKTNIPRNIE